MCIARLRVPRTLSKNNFCNCVIVKNYFTKILDKKKPTTEQNSIELLTIIPADRDTLEVLALLAGRALE